MTFVIQGQITLDAKGVVTGVKVSKGQLDALGKAGKKASDELGGIGNRLPGVGAKGNAAAGQVGNLAAQFNDIGVMLAAGQNPLQLAIQQGTQITQVIGPMGAAGAAKALGGALRSMVSPVSLLTLGTIAGGAALFQWGMNALKAEEDGGALEDRLDALREKQAGLNYELRAMQLGVSEEELTLRDAITAAEESLDEALQKQIVSRGQSNRASDAAVERAREGLALARAELTEHEQINVARETAARGAAELADQERLLGAQMQNTHAEMVGTERLVQLMNAGVKATTFEAAYLAGIDLSSPIASAEDYATLLEIGLSEAQLAAAGLANTDFSSVISTAANEAARLADNLFLASRVGLRENMSDEDLAMSQSLEPAQTTNAVANYNRLTAPRIGRVGGGGGGARAQGRSDAAREAEREREAVEDLLASLQQELEVSREHDPVLQEMIGHREDLKAATDEERAAVENLIRTRIQEEAALERQREGWDFWGDAALTALNDVDGALEMVLKSLQQAALLGTGPLGGLFGGTNSSGAGGLLGMVIGAITGKADGGEIYGQGGPRDDKQLIAASPGEFIVNAKATSRNRALLDRINSGGVPAFANGGMIAQQRGATGSGTAPPAGGRMDITVNVNGAMGDKDIEARARAGTAAAIAEYSDTVLPMRVREISSSPEWIG